MSESVTVTLPMQLTLNVETIADVFAQMTDDEQARFFVEVAKRFQRFGAAKADLQAWLIGGHLRNCDCSTDDARELVRTIAAGIEQSTHGVAA